MSTSSTRLSVNRVPRTHRRRPRHRWLWFAAVAALLITVTTVWRLTSNEDLAADAMVSASSASPGFPAASAVAPGSAAASTGWRSAGETTGAWLELSWSREHLLRHIVVTRNPLQDPGVTDGYLTFGDGSYLQVRLSTTSPETVVPFTARSVGRLQFTASAVSPGSRDVSIVRIAAPSAENDTDVVVDDATDGNAAPHATATQSDGDGGSDPAALRDGSPQPSAAGVGAEWTADRAEGAWVQLDWDRPRELSSIEVVGSAHSAAALAGATVDFGDGSRLPVGAVLSAPERPTIVSFMPRVTKSVRLTFTRVDGAGAIALSELRTYQRGATPLRSPTPPTSPTGGAGVPSSAVACDSNAAGAPQSGLVVRCPSTGSDVDGTVDLEVAAAAGFNRVTAVVWPADGTVAPGAAVTAQLDATGTARLPVDVSSAPPGPLTVDVTADGPDQQTSIVHFQLFRRTTDPAADVASSAATTGRTLAYADEFDRPISLSRNGQDADYAASKPTAGGVQDFGDAIFADPAQGFGNVGVVDDRYLRIDVDPTPPGYADPAGRTHVGGLLASARPGGSGFSAQYGYFEARMFAPAAPGTWPAFWMLPSDNLVTPTPAVAEIDATELYGHEPTGACHSTHDYRDGKDYGVARCGQRFPTDRVALSWHTYGVSILPTGNTFYIDGHVVATAPQVTGGGAPMFFLINLALGGGWPVQLQGVQDRATLYVDYVRVYV